MRARWYDSGLGRFISRDPIGLRGGTNAYSYASNSPLRFSDPFGKQPGDVPPEIQAQRPEGFSDIDVLPNSPNTPMGKGKPVSTPITPSSPDDNYLVGDWFMKVDFKAFCVCPAETEIVESGWEFVDNQDVAGLHGSGRYAKVRRSPGRLGIGFICKCKNKNCEVFNGTIQVGTMIWSDPVPQNRNGDIMVG